MIKLLPLMETQIRGINKAKPTLIFPEAKDERIIAAASHLAHIANVVLVNSRDDVARRINENAIPIQGSTKRFFANVRCVLPDDVPEICNILARRYHEMSHGKRWEATLEEARAIVREPIAFACMAVKCGYADCVLGGVAHTSRDFFRPALRLLRTDKVAFEVGIFSLPDEHPAEIYQHNLVAFADVAINPEPNVDELAQIAVGACKIVRDLIPTDVLPRINGAVLSYSTRGSAEGESVHRIRAAGKIIPAMLEDLAAQDPLYATISIEPELQISCAISIAAAQSKLKDALADPASAVGRANVLVVSSLDTGNILYHLYATRYNNADRLLMIGGLNSQVLDYSRSATVQDIVLGAAGNVLRIKRRQDWQHTPHGDLFPRYRILIVNPGSTSTKLKAFAGTQVLFEREVEHSSAALAQCPTIFDQTDLRMEIVRQALAEEQVDLAAFHAIVGRGGLIKPVVSGTYHINDAMLEDLRQAKRGEHASNLGAPIARALAAPHNLPAFIVDPVVVDELDPISRVVGVSGYERRAIWHALSQKAAAKFYADQEQKDYDALNLIVTHMGGGVTVGAHHKGRCVFVNDGLYEGPITPERAGSLPSSILLDLCLDQGLDKKAIQAKLKGQGGLVALLGTASLREVEARIEANDKDAAFFFDAMAHSIAAQIAATTVRFQGEAVDRIIVTGGMARCRLLIDRLYQLLHRLNIGITVYPGEMEAEALRDGAIRVLRGQEEALTYG